MFPYNFDHLQLLLETEGGDLGNLSQHLAVMGITWEATLTQDPASRDPGDRLLFVTAELRVDAGCWRGRGLLVSDCSGDWTFEEAVLSVLEVALRDLWEGREPFKMYTYSPPTEDIPF